MSVIVTNIQRFCLHDGPGIRTTIFLKGCNLRCPWCSNPENLSFEIENEYGYEISLDDLEKEILKDREYYATGGGVTFSGGEALFQFDKIELLLDKLKKQKIHMCIETALSVPEHFVDIAIKYIDEFIIDIKILDEDNVDKINGNLKLFKTNVNKVFSNNKKVTFRIPLAKDYIVTENNLNLIYELLLNYKPDKVEIFKIHNLAEKKYKTLNMDMIKLKNIEEQEIENIKNKIKDLGIHVEICKI